MPPIEETTRKKIFFYINIELISIIIMAQQPVYLNVYDMVTIYLVLINFD